MSIYIQYPWVSCVSTVLSMARTGIKINRKTIAKFLKLVHTKL